MSVLRGTAVDAYGDVTDSFTPYETGVPAALVESAKTVFDPASQEPRTIRTITCVVPWWLDVLDTDTISVPATGQYYEINDITLQPSLGAPPDLVLTLKERTAAGLASD